MKRHVVSAFVAGILAGLGTQANAADPFLVPVYDGPSIDYLNSPACLPIGDGIGCSLPLLNYFHVPTIDPVTTQTPTGYVIATPQGALAPYIVLEAGGGAWDNSDLLPNTPLSVEDGFKSNAGGADDFRATGLPGYDTNGDPIVGEGNLGDPTDNALVTQLGDAADLPGTWDVGLDWLIDALSPDGIRRELMIGFDYNQPQNALTSLDYWALITVRDLAGTNPLADVNYEIKYTPPGTPNNYFETFTTTKNIYSKPAGYGLDGNGQPLPGDFSTVNGVTCIDTNGSEAIPILPQPGGNCPSGYEVTVNNAQATNSTEIVAFLPELSARLEKFLSVGYDVVSVRMMFGCFGETPEDAAATIPEAGKPGDASYLASGFTYHCEAGGFPDVYLLAGAPQRMPEPATLALIATASLGFVGLRRRRRV